MNLHPPTVKRKMLYSHNSQQNFNKFFTKKLFQNSHWLRLTTLSMICHLLGLCCNHWHLRCVECAQCYAKPDCYLKEGAGDCNPVAQNVLKVYTVIQVHVEAIRSDCIELKNPICFTLEQIPLLVTMFPWFLTQRFQNDKLGIRLVVFIFNEMLD